MKIKRILGYLLMIPMLAGVLAGCGGKGTQQEDISGQVQEFNNSIQKQEAEDTAGNKDILVGSVNMGMNGEWFNEVMNGIRDAGTDMGVQVKLLDSDNDLDKESENVDQLIKEGMDVLVISPLDSEKSKPAVERAKAAGIPVVTWNTTINTEVTTSVLVNSDDLGGDTGDYVCEYVKTNNLKDQKMIIVDNKNYDVGIARCDGFKNSIKELVEEGMVEIVAEDDAETFDASKELTAKLLKEHTEATMLWAWNQPSLLGAIDAAKEAGRKDLIIMGTDMSMELARDMLGDDVKVMAITTQLPYNMGYKAVVSGVKAVRKQNPERNIMIPLATYTKEDSELIQRYIDVHEKLAEENEGDTADDEG